MTARPLEYGQEVIEAGAKLYRLRQFALAVNTLAEAGESYFYAARFRAAHLFFIASLIRLRADADKWRFTPLLDWAGRPGPRLRPCKAMIAALRRSRSASNSSMIVAVSMLLLGDNECTQLYMRRRSYWYWIYFG
jgi:hypothetical protein